ncbi:phosphoglycolate phosphatase, bacterial [Aureimonas endophytica]|uniref:Phosphoglycolate phosphatase n=1 Tax=Aureimonas endophytica TaxID=2027858 RepID=A0A917E7W7_9HYPH|nr:phosphoglycolate phosphatase [Aureimonas endophytica]GGE13699.1 phosphoglycolate phosphatase, bacterial [Aureimonas endophytica]
MKPAGWPRAILFDLDGTLVDSAPDIHAALNQTLESYGEPPLTLEAVTKMIGRGVPVLIERAYAALGIEIDPATRDRVAERYTKLYEARATELTVLMAGVSDLLRDLAAKGVRLGTVTNKPGAATRTVLEHFGLLDLMAVVVGGDAGPPRKPEPGLILHACRELGIEPGEAVFVGDSENDVLAARAAGMAVVAVAGGYTELMPEALGADRAIDRLEELPAALLALAEGDAAPDL